MSTTEAVSKVFEEIAQLFGSGPTDEQILNFRLDWSFSFFIRQLSRRHAGLHRPSGASGCSCFRAG